MRVVLGIIVLLCMSIRRTAQLDIGPETRVVVVGNGPSVLHGERGAFVDGHDLVVRFNTAPLIPTKTGARTDVHVVSAGYVGPFKKDARDRVVVDNHPMLRLLFPHPSATSLVTPPHRGATNVLTLMHHILSRNPRQHVTLMGVDDVDWQMTKYEDAHYFAIDHPEKPRWNRWTDRIAMKFHRDEASEFARILATHPNVTRV